MPCKRAEGTSFEPRTFSWLPPRVGDSSHGVPLPPGSQCKSGAIRAIVKGAQLACQPGCCRAQIREILHDGADRAGLAENLASLAREQGVTHKCDLLRGEEGVQHLGDVEAFGNSRRAIGR